MVTVIQNARIVTDEQVLDHHLVVIENGKIQQVLPASEFSMSQEKKIIDLRGNFLSPGWIDLHCHGAGGVEFISGQKDEILAACRIHAHHGTRVLYPTISATDFETIWHALEALEEVRPQCPLEIPGVHLEGPYLSPDMCGAQDSQYITAPVEKDYQALLQRFGSLIARWTYAPERDDGTLQDALNKNGVIGSMGHSAAEYTDVIRALEKGCRLVTHLYSCTSTITRHSGFRRLGIIETAYLMDEMYVEAIADGCHLPPELMRLIIKQKGTDRVCLITDAISFAGMENCDALHGGTASMPYLVEDGVAKLMDRSAFAGSIATTDVLVKRTVSAGIEMPKVIRMMTQTPAQVMGLSGKGRIAHGYDAQFTIFDDQFHCLPEFEGMI